MYKIAFALSACALAAACSPTTTGTVAGATTGALVGGPVGAVVGAGVGTVAGAGAGAAAGATTTAPIAARPGYCYVYDQRNVRLNNAYGDPVVTRC